MRRLALALVALLVPAVQAVQAEDLPVAQSFRHACLAPEGGFEPVARHAESIGAGEQSDQGGMPPPLVIPSQTRRWLKGDSEARAAGDIVLVASTGTILDRPAQACMVMGPSTVDPEPLLLAQFADIRFIGKSKAELSPPWRYWLVEDEAIGPALLLSASPAMWDGGPPIRILAMVRPDSTVIDLLTRGLLTP